MEAARWMHVAPWELAKQSVWWQRWALIAARAEADTIQGMIGR